MSGVRASVICLHSSASTGRQWEPIAARLGDRFEVLAPDLLGYGDVPWPVGAALSLGAEADALKPLLAARPGAVHLIGHSYGGAVALQLALEMPERIASLTLYEPVRFALLAGAPESAAAHAQIAGLAREVARSVARGQCDAAAARFVDYWSGTGSWNALSPRRRDAIAARMPKVRAEFDAISADRIAPSGYARLAMPVRLIGGTRSPAPAREVLRLLERYLPNADARILPGLGHMAPVSDPDAVADALPHRLRGHSDESSEDRTVAAAASGVPCAA